MSFLVPKSCKKEIWYVKKTPYSFAGPSDAAFLESNRVYIDKTDTLPKTSMAPENNAWKIAI